MLGCLLTLIVATVPRDFSPRHEALTRFTYTEYHMGVDARLVVYAKDENAAVDACTAAFARIAQLDSMMSDYREDSELMKLCNQAGGPPVRVSPELFLVLRRAREISERSNGEFDVTVGPLVQLWRKARKTGVLPAPDEIAKARKLTGWGMIHLDPRDHTVRLERKGMRLDLGGIAKGYADDEAQRVLKQHGITRALVEMGGDIVVSGAPPGKKGWDIAVPNAGGADMTFANQAISTSGDTEQFVIIGGTRYSHVVDPRTGMALTSRVQATVVARDGLTADPLSTAMTLLDKSGRGRLLKSYAGAKAYVRVLRTIR